MSDKEFMDFVCHGIARACYSADSYDEYERRDMIFQSLLDQIREFRRNELEARGGGLMVFPLPMLKIVKKETIINEK